MTYTLLPGGVMPPGLDRRNTLVGFDGAGAAALFSPTPGADNTFMQAFLGAFLRSVSAKLQEMAVSGADFGAVPSSVVDQAPALQAALNSGRPVQLEAGTYKCSSPLLFKAASQWIFGRGRNTAGGTKLQFDTGVTQGIVCDSTAQGTSLINCGLAHLLISRPSYAAGTAVVLNEAQSFSADDLIIQLFGRGIDAVGSRVGYWHRVTISARKAGNWCMRLKGNSSSFGGIHVIAHCTWDCADDGFGITGLGQEADGLVLEGAVPTVTTYSLQVVRARRAYVAISGGEAGLTNNPYFCYNYDFQADRIGECGIYLEAGCDFAFDRGWCQGGYNPYDAVTPKGASIYIGPNVSKVRYTGHVGGCAYNNVEIAGDQVMLDSGVIARASSQLGTGLGSYVPTTPNTWDNVVIRATAANVSIMGGSIGTNENGGGARYGIHAEAGASKIRVVGVDLTGNTTGAINDLTGGEMQVIACPGATERLSARGTNTLELGNQGQSLLEVGNSSAGTYVNRLRLGAGIAGTAPIVLAVGSDANIGMLLTLKGTGVGRLRDGAVTDKLTWSSVGLGFNGTAPVAKPAISGSRGGNAALASLLTQLAAMGLITDSTTA